MDDINKKIMYIVYMIKEYNINEKTVIGAMIAHMDDKKILDEFIEKFPRFIEDIKSEQN